MRLLHHLKTPILKLTFPLTSTAKQLGMHFLSAPDPTARRVAGGRAESHQSNCSAMYTKKSWLLLAISKRETALKWNCSDGRYSCIEKVMNQFYISFALLQHIHFLKFQLLTKLWLAAIHLATSG